MAYASRLNLTASLATSERYQLVLELDTLRAELDDIRAKYTALVALLVAATALGAGYSTGTTLVASTFKKNP